MESRVYIKDEEKFGRPLEVEEDQFKRMFKMKSPNLSETLAKDFKSNNSTVLFYFERPGKVREKIDKDKS